MSQKQEKKRRRELRNAINEKFKKFEEHLKPRPRFMPEWIWVWIIKRFIEI